ncbi:conserved hypothetical protein [Histoplasma capsulatum G186AR]|uniref:Uncharacterized protein n=1 Tax=Ajellomyces capsulatus (strain G186AR / H82 / ATCC MYA-2454 / RMSCC 2432) TaxID=447093 RepID=C0NJE1_AJECG|nr:uncharacterized protein HCBG_03271 [Histoplasma capsulatum G186AR]EEH07982.1 conserved hypothetical protein [Histoplasma capsulatum G186AR]
MASYYENHPYNTQHRRAQTADYYEPSYTTSRPSNSRWGGPTDLVRPDEPEDSHVEEIQRDFPPGSYTGSHRTDHGRSGGGAIYAKRRTAHDPSVRRTHSAGGRGRDRHGDHYAPDKGYQRSRTHGYGNRRDHDRYRSSRRSNSRSSTSRTPSPRPRRRKSLSEQALAAFGLGGVSESHSSRRRDDSRNYGSNRGYYDPDYDPSRSRRRRRQRHSSRSRSRSRSRNRDDKQTELARTLRAALTAGAAEAFRARKEPGSWTGEKGKRVLTAAIGAGGANKLIDGHSDKHSKRHLIETTLAGLATNRVVNGPRSRSRSRGRARSEGRGAKELASAGLLAAVGKSAYDHFVSKPRTRERRSANDSDDDSSPDRSRRSRGSKKRSQSVSEYLSKGLAALGLEEGKQSSSHSNRRRERQRYNDDSDSDIGSSDKNRSRRRRSHSRDSNSRDVGSHSVSSSFSSLRDRGAVIPLSVNNGNDTDSESSCLSTDEEKRTHRKLRRREIATTGLPTLAAVHAGYTVVKSLKREERKAQLRQGEIISDKARRQRTKNNLKDVASVAVAAIGIKSTVDERRDAAHHRAKCNSFKARCGKERKERRSTKEREARSLSADDRDHRLSQNNNNNNSPSLVSVKDAPRYIHDGRGNLLRY